MDVSSIHVCGGLHALSGVDGCIVRTLAVLAVPFVRLTAIRGGSSFIPHELGGQGALHGGGSMLHVCGIMASLGGFMGHHALVRLPRLHAHIGQPHQVVLVAGGMRHRQHLL